MPDQHTRLQPTSAFETKGAWLGSDVQDNDWIRHLSPELLSELKEVSCKNIASGQPRDCLTLADFSCSALEQESNRWLEELDQGRGFLLLRGLPVKEWGVDVSSMAYLGLGLSLGNLVSQNAAGEILGHIRDTGANPQDPGVRLYQTREAQPFHTDGADIIGLLCLQPAKHGGLSRIVSSISVLRAIHENNPDLAPLLYEPFHFDFNEEQAAGDSPTFQLPIANWDGDRLSVFYIGWYIRKAQRHANVPRLGDKQLELLDLIDRTASDPRFYLDMDFQPGDIQLLKNSTTLHARTAYQDWQDENRRRHLLRIWVAVSRPFQGSDERLRSGIQKK